MCISSIFFFFNDTATTEIYTLSLHDALPISSARTSSATTANPSPCSSARAASIAALSASRWVWRAMRAIVCARSEEHTSELQSRLHLVCRLLLEKKKKKDYTESLCKISRGSL